MDPPEENHTETKSARKHVSKVPAHRPPNPAPQLQPQGPQLPLDYQPIYLQQPQQPPQPPPPAGKTVVMPAKESKLSLTTYSSKIGYRNWRNQCLLQFHLDEKYNNVVHYQNNKLTLNQHMTSKESNFLFLALSKALKEEYSNVAGNADIALRADELELWRMMDAHFLQNCKGSVLLKSKIEADFKSICKQENESMAKYTVRLQEGSDKMKLNNVALPTADQMGLQILQGMNRDFALVDNYKELDSNPTIFDHKTIRTIVDEAIDTITKWKSI